MDTKDQLIKTVKEWVKLDNEIRTLQKEQAQRKSDKKKISTSLIDIMKQHEIDSFDIKNGQICYTKKNIKKPITRTLLLEVLSKYFKGDTLKAAELSNYVADNREEVVQESITLKTKKE